MIARARVLHFARKSHPYPTPVQPLHLNSGFTDPNTTRGWGIVDFDWSNSKQKWVTHTPMDDEEMLFEQVQMTTAASPGTTVWVYRCSVYAYP
jgi:hypothetical protein